MKRMLALLVALVTALSVCACNDTNRKQEQPSETSYGASDSESGDEASEELSEQEGSLPEVFEMSERVEKINSCLKYDYDSTLKARNVFQGMKYSFSSPPSVSYPDDKFTKLTDGVTRDVFDKWNWVGFDGSSSVEILFDLSVVDSRIAVIEYSVLCQVSYGIRLPSSVVLYVSDDGEEYTAIGEILSPADADDSGKYVYRFALPRAISPSYVKLTAKRDQGGFLFLDEIFAYEYSENGTVDINSGEVASAYEGYVDYYEYSLSDEVTVSIDSSDSDYGLYRNLAALEGSDIQILHFDPLQSSENNTSASQKDKLTDGKRATSASYGDGAWFKFSRGYGRHIVVDLGNVMAVDALKAEFLNNVGAGIAVPPVVCVAVSTDGENWVTVYGDVTIPYGDKSNNCRYELEASFKETYKARYVRLSFCTVPKNEVSSMVYLSEVEVWGKKDSSFAHEARYDPTVVYGNYPDPEALGVKAIMLSALGNIGSKNVMTEENAVIYYGKHDENGDITDIFFDSFCFSPANSFSKTGDVDTDSKKFIDELFAAQYNLFALDKAVEYVNGVVGVTTKPTYWISLYCLGAKATSSDELYDVLRSQVDYALEKVKAAKLENIRLAGFYYNDEYIPREKEEITVEALSRLNEYLHSIGLMSLWCPYYNAYGIWRWRDAGFDIACLQPNYMFYSTESTRLATCAETAKIYGMCVELEIEDVVSEGSCAIYREYLAEGVKNGYMKSVQMYYEGAVGGAVYKAYNAKAEHSKDVYEDTYKYVRGILDGDYNSGCAADLGVFPDTMNIEVANGKQVFFELGSLSDVAIRFLQIPVYGKVGVNNSGRCRYYSMKGYKGSDSLLIEISDTVGNKKTITVNITVTG